MFLGLQGRVTWATGILLKALDLVPFLSLMVGGPMASVGVDPTKVLDLGEGGSCQLIT